MRPRLKDLSQPCDRRNIGTGVFLAALTLFALATRELLAAEQQRVLTTLIPYSVVTAAPSKETVFTSGKAVLLRYRADALPKNAIVEKATLRLVNEAIGESPSVTIYAYFLSPDSKWKDPAFLKSLTTDHQQLQVPNPQFVNNFGAWTFGRTEPSKTKPWAEWSPNDVPPLLKDGGKLQSTASFGLLLLPSNTDDLREWHSLTASSSQNRPRLILEYTVPGRAPVVQAEGVPAMHSVKAFAPTPGARLISRRVTTDSPTDSLWSYAPVFYGGGVVYVMAKENSYRLLALSPLGGQQLWSSDPLNEPGQHLVASESGRLYIVGKEKIIVYQVDPSNVSKPATEVKTSGGQPLGEKVKDLNPTLAPAVGPDGSLYYVQGQEVYGRNPDLQKLWKVTLARTETSRLTVGPSGRFVYLLGYVMENAIKDGKEEPVPIVGLIAIDTRTGDVSIAKLPNSSNLVAAPNPSLRAPVVIRHPDGTEKVYVAASSTKDGVLALFDNTKTVSGNGQNGNIIAAEKWKPIDGLWSRPIIDQSSPAATDKPAEANSDKRLYAVRVAEGKGTLHRIDWLSGSLEKLGSEFEVGDSPYLLSKGNIAMDQAGNILVWANPKATELDAFRWPNAHAKFPSTEKSKLALTTKSGLLFGPDGTLYALDPGDLNARALRAVVPYYNLGPETVADIDSPTYIYVNGNAGKKTTLTAGSSVSLGAGFSVKKGTTLTVRTNPNP